MDKIHLYRQKLRVRKAMIRTFAALALVIAAMIMVGWMFKEEVSKASRINCDAFTSWGEAQHAFNKDPKKYDRLDGDNDGIACEKLLKR